jgi:hypothetical protein
MELYSQANSLAPTDSAILERLAALYESEGDKAQAFQCHYDVTFLYLIKNGINFRVFDISPQTLE